MLHWTIVFFLLLSTASQIFCEEVSRRIEAHLLLKDYEAAQEECAAALRLFPDSLELLEKQIVVKAACGNEMDMMTAWERYQQINPDKNIRRVLIENMAWGVLDKAAKSPSVCTRAIALMASFYSQGSRGVNILHEHLRDENTLIRALAVTLAGKLRDTKLIDEIIRLFKEEKNWIVRKEILIAMGQMKIRALSSELEDLIASDHTAGEEKSLAIKAMVMMHESMERPEMLRLVQSDRMGLRLLACEAIAHMELLRDRDLLETLTQDTHAKVRAQALQALGQLRPWNKLKEIATKATKDSHYQAAITGAWLLTMEEPELGGKVFEKYLSDPRKGVRLLAAAALSATGKYGISTAKRQLRDHSDPYVRMNIALGLVGQQQELPLCGAVFNECLSFAHDRWNWQEKGLFRILIPKASKEREEGESPEVDDLLARLEILNMLAVMQDPSAQTAIKRFVVNKMSSVSGVASALLLTEGDEEAVDIVKQLLNEPSSRVRIRAALLLSLWSRDEAAIKVLQENYPMAEYDMKGNIIEGLGRIGSMSSVPFLIGTLKEPSQALRVLAAMALIHCLNH